MQYHRIGPKKGVDRGNANRTAFRFQGPIRLGLGITTIVLAVTILSGPSTPAHEQQSHLIALSGPATGDLSPVSAEMLLAVPPLYFRPVLSEKTKMSPAQAYSALLMTRVGSLQNTASSQPKFSSPLHNSAHGAEKRVGDPSLRLPHQRVPGTHNSIFRPLGPQKDPLHANGNNVAIGPISPRSQLVSVQPAPILAPVYHQGLTAPKETVAWNKFESQESCTYSWDPCTGRIPTKDSKLFVVRRACEVGRKMYHCYCNSIDESSAVLFAKVESDGCTCVYSARVSESYWNMHLGCH